MPTRISPLPTVQITLRCECGKSGVAFPVAAHLSEGTAENVALVPGRSLTLPAMFHVDGDRLLCRECPPAE